MNLTQAQVGEEYIIKEILTDDEELNAFLLALGATAVNRLRWFPI